MCNVTNVRANATIARPLEVQYRDKSISDVLEMTVDEAAEFFKAVPSIRDKMVTLQRVGLGYIKVGQQATTLSGGEAQRVKLAKELSRKATGRTFYILDEPTTGLHFEDVRKLLEVLQTLVENGNTVVVIEHNLEVIKTADWIIDIGPDGGDKGGDIVAMGTPEQVIRGTAQSYRTVSGAVSGAPGSGISLKTYRFRAIWIALAAGNWQLAQPGPALWLHGLMTFQPMLRVKLMSKSMMFLILAIMSEVAGTTALKFTDGFHQIGAFGDYTIPGLRPVFLSVVALPAGNEYWVRLCHLGRCRYRIDCPDRCVSS